MTGKSDNGPEEPLVRRLFLQALELQSQQDRQGFLAKACGSDLALLAKVEALLLSHREDGFLERPAEEAISHLFTPAATPVFEKPGDFIGRYKLLEKIGEGGCGVVYGAEQEHPVRRRVALKVIKLGMDTRSVVARFEAERQALAMMDHPNIARVLDAGATENGRPFFVMELVKGIPITKYCDQNQLSTSERLGLFVQVCGAVQHAHQKGIIHRDLKPSNILVTLNDGVAVPKVIDFGIAKATEGRLTDKTVYTELRQLIGTPAYMSPEQAEMTSLDIDTRSDIYSLGVLLYELLTGKTPFGHEELIKLGLDAMRLTIRAKEPPPPSTWLSTLTAADLSTVAKARRSEPPKLIQAVRGDLDWIVMKALEKDRRRRYETANGLALDIQRHLNSEPVVACPPSNFYRFQKLIKRNKIAFAAACTVIVTLIFGLGLSTVLFVRETQARQRAASAQMAFQTEQMFRKSLETALQGTERARKAEEEQRKLKEMALVQAERARQAEVEARDKEAKLREIAEAALSHAEGQDYLRRITLAELEWSANNMTEVERVLDECPQNLRRWEWHYLKRLCHEEILTLTGHTRGVRCVAFSPDGKRLASGSYGTVVIQRESPQKYESEKSGEIVVWDVESGGRITTLSNEVFGLNSLSFSPKGDRLAAGGSGGLRVWDLDSSSAHPLDSSCEVGSIAYSPDGLLLASGNTNGTVRIWETTTGLLVRALSNAVPVTGVAFSPDGRFLASTCGQAGHVGVHGNPITEKGEVVLWNCATGERIFTLNPRGSVALAVAFSPNGKVLATSQGDKTIIVWDVTTGSEVTKIKEAPDVVYSVVFSPDSRRLLTGGADKTVRLWDVTTGQEEFVLHGHSREVNNVALSPDGKLIASASLDNTVKIWAARTDPGMQTVRAQTTNRTRISHLAFSRDGSRLAWTGGGLYILDVRTGTMRNLRPELKGGFSKLQFSPGGDSLAASTGDSITIFSTETGENIKNFEGYKAVYGVAFSHDGRMLAAGDGGWPGGDIKIWEIGSGQLAYTLKGDVNVWDVAFSPDGKLLASASGDINPNNPFRLYGGAPGEVRIWDLSTRTQIHRLLGHKFCIWSVVFSPDGTRLATASGAYQPGEPGEVKVWEVGTWKQLFTLTGNDGCIFSVAFGPDGKRIVTSEGSNGSNRPAAVKLWDAETGARILSLAGNREAVYAVAFSPDGTRVASGGQEGILRIWNMQRPAIEGLTK